MILLAGGNDAIPGSGLGARQFSMPRLTACAEKGNSIDKTQQVVVHLSQFADHLHRCFMVLQITKLTQEHGASVKIWLDLKGVRLTERRQPLDVVWKADSPPLSERYDNFIQAGGELVLCPRCADSARIGDGALMRNAETATLPQLAKLLVDADK